MGSRCGSIRHGATSCAVYWCAWRGQGPPTAHGTCTARYACNPDWPSYACAPRPLRACSAPTLSLGDLSICVDHNRSDARAVT
ncbi:unnamed protein product [Urochloa humidicola]